MFDVSSDLTSLAKDMTNRDMLKNALLPPKSLQYAVAMKLEGGPSSRNIYNLKLQRERVKQLQEEEAQRTMAASVMVPWVRWPEHGETGTYARSLR